VVYESGGREPAVALTQLAQRVRRQERCAYPVPRPPVAFVGFGVAVVMVVAFGFLFLMILAVPARGQLGAARVDAGFLGFCMARQYLRFRA